MRGRLGPRLGLLAGLMGLATATASAEANGPFGNHDQAQKNFAEMKTLYRKEGLEATLASLRSEDGDLFQKDTALFVHDRRDGRIYMLAHNKLPDVHDIDLTDTRDLRGRPFIQNLWDAAQNGGGYARATNVPEETEKVHQSRCYAEMAPGDAGDGLHLGYCYSLAFGEGTAE